jgi:hypothetical protein
VRLISQELAGTLTNTIINDALMLLCNDTPKLAEPRRSNRSLAITKGLYAPNASRALSAVFVFLATTGRFLTGGHPAFFRIYASEAAGLADKRATLKSNAAKTEAPLSAQIQTTLAKIEVAFPHEREALHASNPSHLPRRQLQHDGDGARPRSIASSKQTIKALLKSSVKLPKLPFKVDLKAGSPPRIEFGHDGRVSNILQQTFSGVDQN